MAAVLLAHSTVSQAALGGLPEAFRGATVVPSVSTTVSNYAVRATTLNSGTLVREYISSDGSVFAVTWDGPLLPDLRALLGPYFQALVAESEKRPRAGRSHVAVNLPEVVIHSGGHMRAFEGSAWLPAASPAGFSADDLR